jgi:HopA1 effector protein family
MQTLDATPTKPVAVDPELMAVLEDIARNVEIRDDFSIHHPSYKPLEIPAEAVERFQKMPEQMRQKFLSLQLRSFLYGIYYNGGMRSALALDSDDQAVQLDLENNTVLGIDMAFFQQLHDANCGTGYFEEGWKVLREVEDGGVLVQGGGLRLYVERERYLREAEQQAKVGDVVAVRMPKNRMQSGFYMAVSNLGFSRPQAGNALVRVYFNVTAEGSIKVMRSLTRELNEINIPFSFKVLYNPKDYNRFDSGVLYFDGQHYEAVAKVLKGVYSECRSHFVNKIPLFTKQIALGLGVAEEPDNKFADQESFGMNRCQIMTNGLLNSFFQSKKNDKARIKMILNEFNLAGIDINNAYLNCGSQRTYHVIA